MTHTERMVYVGTGTHGRGYQTYHDDQHCHFLTQFSETPPISIPLYKIKNPKPCKYCTIEGKLIPRNTKRDKIPDICIQCTKIKKIQAHAEYPVKSMIPIWTCSDGNEFGTETDALRHELDLHIGGKK
jgi:hypothetical protein